MEKSNSVQSVTRSLTLLEFLHKNFDGCNMNVLVKEFGLPKGTVHRLLASLIDLGYVRQNAESKRYYASMKMYEVGSLLVGQMDTVSVARPYINMLSENLQETVHIVVRDGWEAMYVYKAEAGPLSMSSRLGRRIPLYCSAVGKAILASLPYKEVEEIWARSTVLRLTDKTITTFSDLEKELRTVKSQGWAMDDEENEIGIRCVAVALPERGDSFAKTAFSISGMAAKMSDDRITLLAEKCLDIRRQVLSEMGMF